MLPSSPGAAKLWRGSDGLFMVVTLRKGSSHDSYETRTAGRTRIGELRPRRSGPTKRKLAASRPAALPRRAKPSRECRPRRQDGDAKSSSATAVDDESCPDGTSARISFAGRIQAGDKFGERVADSHSLKVGQGRRRDARESDRPRARPADHRGKRGRLILDESRIALAEGFRSVLKIVMMLEKLPCRNERTGKSRP